MRLITAGQPRPFPCKGIPAIYTDRRISGRSDTGEKQISKNIPPAAWFGSPCGRRYDVYGHSRCEEWELFFHIFFQRGQNRAGPGGKFPEVVLHPFCQTSLEKVHPPEGFPGKKGIQEG